MSNVTSKPYGNPVPNHIAKDEPRDFVVQERISTPTGARWVLHSRCTRGRAHVIAARLGERGRVRHSSAV